MLTFAYVYYVKHIDVIHVFTEGTIVATSIRLDPVKAPFAGRGNPRAAGKALTGPRLGAYWRYRVGDYRILCDIQDDALRILVIDIGNRREVYR